MSGAGDLPLLQSTKLPFIVITFYRSARSGHWTPTLIRGYSTLVCTVLFYTTIHRVERLEEYKGLMWWLPWMWHLHAGVCQGASLEVVGGYYGVSLPAV